MGSGVWQRSRAASAARRSSLLASISCVAQIPHSCLDIADRLRLQGTTFSGVAFAFATNTEAKEDIIVEWPGAGTQTKQKVGSRDIPFDLDLR